MSKPLTIEELKALQVGDWVWVIDENFKNGRYRELLGCDDFGNFYLSAYCASRNIYSFSDYGTKWLAYKNKENAEAKGEIRRFAEYVGSKIAGHSDYHGDNILSALYCAAEGKEIKDITPLESKGEIVEFPCLRKAKRSLPPYEVVYINQYDSVVVERYSEESSAECRLAELKGTIE